MMARASSALIIVHCYLFIVHSLNGDYHDAEYSGFDQ